jgi:YVTN family beta-propeller protein
MNSNRKLSGKLPGKLSIEELSIIKECSLIIENGKWKMEKRRALPFSILHFTLSILAASLLLFSCKKKPLPPEVPAPALLEHGILVLDEGLFNQNNSALSWINTVDHTVSNTFFEDKTNRGLGDTGNDMERYGGKIYIVINVSSTVEILDAATGNSLQQISMIANGVPKQPRSIAFYGAKAYVTCYDGFVDVIDTTSMSVVQRIAVGNNPEGLAVSNGKLYVANSGGLNYPDVDSTVSVIDLSTHQELLKITIGNNPGGVCVDSEGDVYAVSRGNYSSIPSRMHRIDPVTDTRVETFPFDAGSMVVMNDRLLVSYYDFNSGSSSIGLFDALTEQMINPSFVPTTGITTLYGIYYSPVTNKIYCSDANSFTNTGFIHLFSAAGMFERTYSVGLNPSKVLVYE